MIFHDDSLTDDERIDIALAEMLREIEHDTLQRATVLFYEVWERVA